MVCDTKRQNVSLEMYYQTFLHFQLRLSLNGDKRTGWTKNYLLTWSPRVQISSSFREFLLTRCCKKKMFCFLVVKAARVWFVYSKGCVSQTKRKRSPLTARIKSTLFSRQTDFEIYIFFA